MGFDLNALDQYTEKEATRRLQELKTMSIVRSGQVIKLAIEKEGQLPLLTTFDQVYRALKHTGNLPSCCEVDHASLDVACSTKITLIHCLYDSNWLLFKATPFNINKLLVSSNRSGH